MTIEHSVIADADRHEVKHASTATVGQALIANGDGTTKFDAYDYTKLTNKPTGRGYLDSIYGASTASSQAPTTTNTALQVEFGPAQSNTDCSLGVDGTITFNTAGQYIVKCDLGVGRAVGTGSAVLFIRVKKNGAQLRNSKSFTLTDLSTVISYSDTIFIDAAIGDYITFEIIRDSSGINDGGLYQTTPSASGWNISPTASVNILKNGGLL